MTLPIRNEREYLELSRGGGDLTLIGQKKHIDELEGLYRGRKFSCWREGEVLAGQDCLHFMEDAVEEDVVAVLDSYKNVKGS